MKPTIPIDDPEITRLGVAAANAFCRAMAKDQLQDDEIVAITIGIEDPILNIVMHAQTTETKVADKITAVFQFFKQHQVKWTWVISPLSKPHNLAHHLLQRGLILLEEFPSMHFDLTKPLTRERIHFDIREAAQMNDLKQWIIPIAEAFPGSDASDDGEEFRIVNNNLPHGPGTALRHYTAFHDNQPVSSITLFLCEHGAMIHNLGTRNEYCGKGFGTALTRHALREAKQLGFKHCFLDSSPRGFNVYQRIGFKVYAMCPLYGLPESS